MYSYNLNDANISTPTFSVVLSSVNSFKHSETVLRMRTYEIKDHYKTAEAVKY